MSPQEKKTTGASKKPAAAGGRSRKAAGSAPARQSEEANGVNNEILSTLCSIPFFSSLADDEKNLQVLASFMSKEKVPAATVVVREGEVGDKLYILYRGEVEVIRRTLDNEEYKVAMLRYRDQAFFGELALLDEDKRSATIRTATDTEMLVLTRADFIRMGNDYPEIGLLVTRSLASIICKRFRSTNNDVILLFEALVNEIRSEELA